MEDGVDGMCKSLGNMAIKVEKKIEKPVPAIPVTKYALPSVVQSYVPPTPCTPYVPPKAEKENTPLNANISSELRTKFNNLVLRARDFEAKQNYAEALHAYVQAMYIRPGDERLERKISTLSKLASSSPSAAPAVPSKPQIKTEIKTESRTGNKTEIKTEPSLAAVSHPPVNSKPQVPSGPKPPQNSSNSPQNTGKPPHTTVQPPHEKSTQNTHQNALQPLQNAVQPTKPLHITTKPLQNTTKPAPQVQPKATLESKPIIARDKEQAAKDSRAEKDEKRETEAERGPSKGKKEQVIQEEAGRPMVEQPNGFFHDQDNDAYVLKSKDEDTELSVSSALYKHLFDYQREGVKWMWGLFISGNGGILGDDMGLGKTMQVVGFIASMIRSGHISKVLIVMPVSVLEHWRSELEKWGEGIRVKVFHGTSKKERETNLRRVKSRGGVLLTTYGMVLNQTENLCSLKWDYIVFDEGHKIKDPLRQITKKSKELRSVNKILLSGTPIQNNLKEMWALFDWACDGRLLGNDKSFRAGYENPIVAGLDKNATREEKQIGETVSASLMALIRPYFLRRDKKTLFGSNPQGSSAAPPKPTQSPNSTKSPPKPANVCSTKKNDLVVWLTLSEPQTKLYTDFLGSEEVRLALNQTQSHLAALTRLKQICTHPALLTQDTAQKPLEYHKEQSAKIAFLAGLIPELRKNGHRLLIFSQYTTMLDIIQSCVVDLGCKFVRIDGSINSTAERERRIKSFNQNKDIFCFLLTTGAGALGINLTSADRVLIFDPSWNTNDNQAVDRAYRVGQKRDVVIYRLITCGTIDEKMYRKQVYKAALQGMMKAGSQYRYFSKQDLSEMFTLDDTSSSATQNFLTQLHDHSKHTYPYLDEHIQFLHESLRIVGVNHHDLLFSENPEDLEHSEEGRVVAARAQSSLFSEPTGTRRRKAHGKTPAKTPVSKPKKPRSKAVVVEDDDDYDMDLGTRSFPISLNDEAEAQGSEAESEGERETKEEERERKGEIESEEGTEVGEAGDREVTEKGEGEGEEEIEGEAVKKPFRRLRRMVVDDPEEENGGQSDGEETRSERVNEIEEEREEEGEGEVKGEGEGEEETVEVTPISVDNEEERGEKEDKNAILDVSMEAMQITHENEDANASFEKNGASEKGKEIEREGESEAEDGNASFEIGNAPVQIEREGESENGNGNASFEIESAPIKIKRESEDGNRSFDGKGAPIAGIQIKRESESEKGNVNESGSASEIENGASGDDTAMGEIESAFGEVDISPEEPSSDPCEHQSCAKHKEAASPFVCLACSCFLSRESAMLFRQIYEKAKKFHQAGKLREALSLYKELLVICDEDIELHTSIIRLELAVSCMDM